MKTLQELIKVSMIFPKSSAYLVSLMNKTNPLFKNLPKSKEKNKMKTIFMWSPIVIFLALLLFGQDISDWVRATRIKYESYQSASSRTNNCVIVDGVIYDKKGRKQ